MSRNYVDGFGAAHRQADNAGAIKFQELEESKYILRRRVRPGRRIRLTIAPGVEAHYRVVAREILDLGVPHSAVRESRVQKNQRSALAVDFIVQVSARNLCLPAGPKILERSSAQR
jgi:hypothetical protein